MCVYRERERERERREREREREKTDRETDRQTQDGLAKLQVIKCRLLFLEVILKKQIFG